MKTSGVTRTALLSLLLGLVVLACAAQDRPADGSKDKDHSRQDNKHQQGQPEQRREHQSPQSNQEQRPALQQQRQPAHSQQQRPDDSRRQDPQARQPQSPPVSREQEHDRQHRSATIRRGDLGQHYDQQAAWQQHRAANWQSDHRTWRQRGGYAGYRIPDNRFRGSFGPEHGFRIHGLPFRVVGGYPRFQYGGYWLSIVDPWPAEWGNDWYDNDQVYVVFVDNGYYLYNRSYPERGIAISISM